MMKLYFALATGVLALGIETLVFLALMELPPFSKGASDIIWGVPCLCLLVAGLAGSGLLTVLAVKPRRPGAGRLAAAGLILNGLSLALPVLLLLAGIIRAAV